MNYIADYRGRTDLISNYGSNSLLLYALQLRFDLSDIASVASESLTDGSNDKKCDLIYVYWYCSCCTSVSETKSKGYRFGT